MNNVHQLMDTFNRKVNTNAPLQLDNRACQIEYQVNGVLKISVSFTPLESKQLGFRYRPLWCSISYASAFKDASYSWDAFLSAGLGRKRRVMVATAIERCCARAGGGRFGTFEPARDGRRKASRRPTGPALLRGGAPVGPVGAVGRLPRRSGRSRQRFAGHPRPLRHGDGCNAGLARSGRWALKQDCCNFLFKWIEGTALNLEHDLKKNIIVNDPVFDQMAQLEISLFRWMHFYQKTWQMNLGAALI